MRHADTLRLCACALLLSATPLAAQQPPAQQPPSVPVGQRSIERANQAAGQANARQQAIDSAAAAAQQQAADSAAQRQAADSIAQQQAADSAARAQAEQVERATAQQPEDTLPIGSRPAQIAQAGELQLKFDREVFDYPGRGRRDPFQPLTGSDAGPLFNEITLHMILYVQDNPSESIVALSDATKKVHRLRRGDSLGGITVVDIGPRRVVFSVNDFGIRRQEILELKAPGRNP